MNRRLRLAGLGLLAMMVMSVLAVLPASAAQAATVRPDGLSGWGPIINWGSRGCVDVRTEDGPYNWGAHVQNWQCTGVSEQQWYFAAQGGGYYSIVNERSSLCLDAGGFWAVQWGCNGTRQQLWQIVWRPGFPSGGYQLQAGNGLCLELTGGNGAQGQLLSNNSCSSWYAQWWEIR